MTNFKVISTAFWMALTLSLPHNVFSAGYDQKTIVNSPGAAIQPPSIEQLAKNFYGNNGEKKKDLLEKINAISDMNEIRQLVYTIPIPWMELIPGITNVHVRETLMNTKANPESDSYQDFIDKAFILENRMEEIESMLNLKWPISRETAVGVMKSEMYNILLLFLRHKWKFNEKEDLEFVKATFQRGSEFSPNIINKDTIPIIEKMEEAQAVCRAMVVLNLIIPGTEAAALEFLVLEKKMTIIEKTPYLKELINQPLKIEQKSAKTLARMIRSKHYDWAVLLIERGWPLSELDDRDLKDIHHCKHRGIKKLVFPGVRGFFQRHF